MSNKYSKNTPRTVVIIQGILIAFGVIFSRNIVGIVTKISEEINVGIPDEIPGEVHKGIHETKFGDISQVTIILLWQS